MEAGLKRTTNKQSEVFARNVSQDIENLLYEYGIKDWMLQSKIVDMITDKWCEQKGIER